MLLHYETTDNSGITLLEYCDINFNEWHDNTRDCVDCGTDQILIQSEDNKYKIELNDEGYFSSWEHFD